MIVSGIGRTPSLRRHGVSGGTFQGRARASGKRARWRLSFEVVPASSAPAIKHARRDPAFTEAEWPEQLEWPAVEWPEADWTGFPKWNWPIEDTASSKPEKGPS